MARNVEIKARLACRDETEKRVAALTPNEPLLLVQRDTFFAVPHGRLKLRRIEGSYAELISYDRPDTAGPSESIYTRCPVSDPDVLGSILESSLGIAGEVVKRRTLYWIGQTRVHIDDVDGLGSFLELEVVLDDDQAVSDGEATARDLMDQFGITPDELVACAYVDLLPAAS